jgi:hypothetical protein
MIKPVLEKISCMIVDVINDTLASCDYRDCNEICTDYLQAVSHQCPVVFHNEVYLELWNTLFRICNEVDEQSHMFFIDNK